MINNTKAKIAEAVSDSVHIRRIGSHNFEKTTPGSILISRGFHARTLNPDNTCDFFCDTKLNMNDLILVIGMTDRFIPGCSITEMVDFFLNGDVTKRYTMDVYNFVRGNATIKEEDEWKQSMERRRKRNNVSL